MRSHAKAPSAGSVWIAASALLAIALLALVSVLAASPAAAAIESTGAEGASAEKDDATLNGWYVSTDGKEAHYFFEWGETEAYDHVTQLPPGAVAGSEAGLQQVPPVQISGLDAETTYHYRLVVSDADGVVNSGDATFVTAPAVTNLTADPATGVTAAAAELNASFDGDGLETSYYFEWGSSVAYGSMAPAPPGNSVPAAGGRVQVPPVAIAGLERGATYHYRVKATNAQGTTVSTDASFTTADAPNVSGVHPALVKATSAELRGNVNPRLGQTSYRFEWGSTAAYGNSTPIPAGDAGANNASVPVSVQLDGLDPGVTYHFRLVASNQYGSTASPDQTFGFYPPACPNSQLRQETRSNDLPDCRAYELVTPSFANGAVIMPVAGPNTGLATNPARVAYGVNWGLFSESTGEGTNLLNDLFVSTRSDSGWTQRYIGLPGSQNLYMGGPPRTSQIDPWEGVSPSQYQVGTQASPSMDRIIDYNQGWPADVGLAGFVQHGDPSNAPYVWNSSTGSLLERWPSNLDQVAGGNGFAGIPRASADFTHFVFSSNVVFAAGGEAGAQQEIECCRHVALTQPPPPASVYDNDIKSGGVVLASRRQDGTPFQGYLWDVSDDGSHIIMAEQANFPSFSAGQMSTIDDVDGPFFVRVDGDKTYELATGHKISYAGSTANGETVYLTSTEPLSPQDQDTSRDLYVWHESEPGALTLVSLGDNGAGNTDACSPTSGWTLACGVEIIHVKKFSALLEGGAGADGQEGNGTTDNFLAAGSGDIYFESPEQLDGAKGEPNEVNLYLYRDGTVRYVATMQPGTTDPVARMQVTADGAHMAFTTASSLTEYDSAGTRQMYLFDPASGRLTCASCSPDGNPAVSHVRGSQNGLFLTDDGRAFFSTEDALVPRDTNKADDVYEYTEGRAQLITTGIGLRLGVYNGLQTTTGLVSVSANGADVYFATLDTLVTQDHNGSQVKIYDARTGGGFPAERSEPNCTAADECHGPSSSAPTPPPDRTSVNLGKRRIKAHKAKKKHGKRRRAKGKRGAKVKNRNGNTKNRNGKTKQGEKNHG